MEYNQPVKYASFDCSIAVVAKLGQGASLAKCDIKSAFCLFPVHPLGFICWASLSRGPFTIIKPYQWAVPFLALLWNTALHSWNGAFEFGLATVTCTIIWMTSILQVDGVQGNVTPWWPTFLRLQQLLLAPEKNGGLSFSFHLLRHTNGYQSGSF